MIGLQANASPLTPEELDQVGTMQAEPPEVFAEAMADVRARFGTRVLGGCCGAGQRHMTALTGRLTEVK